MMWKALLIDSNYTHAIRLKKSVDWSSLGISFFVEYNDVCGLEKVCSIKPHILILGKLMFSNVDELAKNLYQQNAQAKLIFVGSNRKWKETEYNNLGAQLLSEAELNTQYIKCLCEQFSDLEENRVELSSQMGGRIDCKEKLTEILSDVRGKQWILLVRIIGHKGCVWPPKCQLTEQLITIFDDFFLDCFWETTESLCLVLKEPEKISILYSIQAMGEMIESLVRYLQSAGAMIYPILVSEKTNRIGACSAYEQVKEMERFLFFCPNHIVFTAAQFQQRRSLDYSEINKLIDEVALGMLDGNPTNALTAVDTIYDIWLKPSMDFSALRYVHERMRDSIELVSTIWDKEIPDVMQEPRCDSIEEERQMIHTAIMQSCREVEQVQGEYQKILETLHYVLKHYGEPLSMESVAQHFRMSSAYFSRQFKKVIGIGFTDYLNRVRILEAKALFRAGENNIEKVANRVGYADPKYFSRVFKRKMNIIPSSYIVQLQDKER